MLLVKHLPRDAAVQRELHGEAAEWSVTDHLLAAVTDHLAVANWMFQCVNTGEDDDQPDYPTPVPRPGTSDDEDDDAEDGAEGTDTEETETISPFALARFFG
ncbi:hypothetical protein ABT160_26190 [Streptomyces sp. NPDC001941]|uniref:hypothetical protein n=1 Tax=Streptomyces sp. NPDC001941 TaxID=3154659 RepID=UPI003328C903